MNITFMIGNGFDLNMGLKTRYVDFIKQYTASNQKANEPNTIQEFKEYILESLEKDNIDWSDAEVAFGQYTSKFDKDNGGGRLFTEQHKHFCIQFNEYLKTEVQRFQIDKIVLDGDLLKDIASIFINYTIGLRGIDKNLINSYVNLIGGGLCFRFLSFNYTEGLDQIISAIKDSHFEGTRIFQNTKYNNSFDNPIHVHGTLDQGMALGVNDESQLAKDIFSDQEQVYKDQIIKPQINANMGELIEERATSVIEESDVMYIYGMSLGVTDCRWWERIIDTLIKKPNSILIINRYGTPQLGLLPTDYISARDNTIEKFLEYGKKYQYNKDEVVKRIFVTGYSLFEPLAEYFSDSSTNKQDKD